MRRAIAFLATFLAPHVASLVVAVTHAAGRMGVSVVGQLREQWQLANTDDDFRVRAIVRSEEEAARLKLDLCGGVLRGGKLMPLLDLKSDLSVDLCVVEDDCDEAAGLTAAFDGADVAVLLSAAHADFTPADGANAAQGVDASAVVPGTAFHARASSAYAAAKAAAKSSGINVRVPAITGAAAARRLAAEVACATSAGASMRHVVLRSSMGCASLEDVSGPPLEQDTQEDRALATLAVARMGGVSTIAAQADAEATLRKRCAQRAISYTVLRLGALVDSAGGVPLAFGGGDAQLKKSVGDEGAKEPPLISRNDAARLVAELVVSGGLGELAGSTVDVAWGAKWGVSSAGTEEAALKASRQDLVGEAAVAAVKA